MGSVAGFVECPDLTLAIDLWLTRHAGWPPQPDFDASVAITMSGSGNLKGLACFCSVR